MKKFSNITGQKVSQEPKIEVKITEADVFKSKVMSLMDDFLRVQMYGPITRYHVAGTMKVAGKELFIEALLDLLDDKSNGDKIKMLESLKSKVTNWEYLDEKIDEIKSQPKNLFKHKSLIKSLYNKYKSDKDLLIEQTKKSAVKLKSQDTIDSRYKACEILKEDSNFNAELIGLMSDIYLNRLKEI
jgi:hypothetical protein